MQRYTLSTFVAEAVRPFLNGRTIDDPISVDN